jgi:hypothetical protein
MVTGGGFKGSEARRNPRLRAYLGSRHHPPPYGGQPALGPRGRRGRLLFLGLLTTLRIDSITARPRHRVPSMRSTQGTPPPGFGVLPDAALVAVLAEPLRVRTYCSSGGLAGGVASRRPPSPARARINAQRSKLRKGLKKCAGRGGPLPAMVLSALGGARPRRGARAARQFDRKTPQIWSSSPVTGVLPATDTL